MPQDNELITGANRDVIRGSVVDAVKAALANIVPGYQGKVVIKVNIQVNIATGGGATINV